MMRFARKATIVGPMERLGRTTTLAGPRGTGALRRSGPALRAGEVLLAIGLSRLSRRAPVTYAVSRTALGLALARRRMLAREAERSARRRRRIRRSIVAGAVLVALAAGTGRALGGGTP
jgi:hypothetical protein